MGSSASELYLDLLKRTLTGMVYEDPPVPVPWVSYLEYREETRVHGIDWPQHAHSMIGLARMNHLQACAEQVLADGIPGDWAEAGVWRGGACIFMRALLKVHAVTDRAVWVIDSFAGLPEADRAAEGFGTAAEQATLIVPVGQVRHNFALYGMLDDQVRFLEGWFRDSLPGAPVEKLAILRMDGDLHSSVTDTLVHLYPKLVPGGYCIVDDWQLPGARQAVLDYRAEHAITERLLPVPGSTYLGGSVSAYWRKE